VNGALALKDIMTTRITELVLTHGEQCNVFDLDGFG
jgi:hypothetical protein